MRKIVGYEQFMKLSKKNADIGAKVVENQLYARYSNNFWDMALASRVFNTEEKEFIRERLLHTEINLRSINENWLMKGWNWIKDKSSKFVKSFVDKIKSIRKGISSFVAGIKNLAVRLFGGFIKNIFDKVQNMFTAKAKAVEDEINKQKGDELIQEMDAVVAMVNWWRGKGKSAKIENVFSEAVDKKKSDIIAKSEEVLKQTEAEAKEETNEDVLYHFYFDQNLITEGAEGEEGGEKKKDSWKTWFMKKLAFWFGSEKELPEDGKKLKWWGKLIIRILFACISPVTTLIKVVLKEFTRSSLNLWSAMTSRFGGPKPSKSEQKASEPAQKTPPIDPKDPKTQPKNPNIPPNDSEMPKKPENLVKEEASPYEKREGYSILGVIPIFGKSVEYYDLKILSSILITAVGIGADGAKALGYASKTVGGHPEGLAGFMTDKESLKSWFSWFGGEFGMNTVMDKVAKFFKMVFGSWLDWIKEIFPGVKDTIYIIKTMLASAGLLILCRTIGKKLKKIWKHHKVGKKIKDAYVDTYAKGGAMKSGVFQGMERK
jgi:hypothetical protein